MGEVQVRSAKICMPRNLKLSTLYTTFPCMQQAKRLSVPGSMEVKLYIGTKFFGFWDV